MLEGKPRRTFTHYGRGLSEPEDDRRSWGKEETRSESITNAEKPARTGLETSVTSNPTTVPRNMCQGETESTERSNKAIPLDVSIHESCDTSASTIPLDNDNDGWRIHEINPFEEWDAIEGPIIEFCAAQGQECHFKDLQKEIAWETLTETVPTEKVLDWLQQHKPVWDNFPSSLLKP